MTTSCRQTLFVTITIVLGLLAGVASAEEVLRRQPNIIVILADDLGYGDLGVYDSALIDTPNLDRMAREGIFLTNFYASASNCTPSRAGLLTGRYAIRSGLAHQVIFVDSDHGLPQTEITIAEMVRPLGYRTAIIGKWHLGHRPEHWPTTQGFDYYYGLPYSNNQFPLALYRNAEKLEEPVDQSALTRRYTDEAIRFIEEHREEPFFIYLPHTFPHIPLHVSQDFRGKSKAGLYGDVVQELDWSTGQILATLERLQLDDDTLVIFTSDNGPYPEGSTGGLRGSKGTAWEGGFRVPFIARWPAGIPPGSVSSGIAMNIDILPTVQAITGADLPDGLIIDGKNIMNLLTGASASPHQVVYYFNDEQIGALRTQRWKMMLQARYRGINRWFPEHEIYLLYDMENDPQERYSVAAQHPDAWQTMLEHLSAGQRELQSLALHLE